MLGKYWVPSRENIIVDLKRTFLYSAMKYGYDIVIDNMNLNPKEVGFYENIIKHHNTAETISGDLLEYQYQIEFRDFKTPLEVCIERDSKRVCAVYSPRSRCRLVFCNRFEQILMA